MTAFDRALAAGLDGPAQKAPPRQGKGCSSSRPRLAQLQHFLQHDLRVEASFALRSASVAPIHHRRNRELVPSEIAEYLGLHRHLAAAAPVSFQRHFNALRPVSVLATASAGWRDGQRDTMTGLQSKKAGALACREWMPPKHRRNLRPIRDRYVG